MQPDQAVFLRDEAFLVNLKNEHQTTRKVIAAIPLDKSDYRPDEISMSALDLGYHITATEMRFLDAIAAGAFDFTPRPRPESIANSADLDTWYAGEFTSRVETLSKLSGEQLAKIVDFRGMFQSPAVMFFSFVIRHSVHHRGQLSTYLRPMGAKVPAIYGESYDTKQARIAAQAQG